MNKVITSILFIFISFLSLGQSTYNTTRNDITKFKLDFVSPDQSVEYKEVPFASNGYSIEGQIKKNALEPNSYVRIYDNTDDSKIFLEGTVIYDNKLVLVKGIKYDNLESGTTQKVGVFFVSNSADGKLILKPKSAGPIVISDYKIDYLCGFLSSNPAIISYKESILYVDGDSGPASYSEMRIPLPTIEDTNIDTDFSELLLKASDECFIKWPDGVWFKGKIKPFKNDDSSISFYRLAGQMRGFSKDSELNSVTVTEQPSQLTKILEGSASNNSYTSISIIVEKEKIPDDSYWDTFCFYKNSSIVKIKTKTYSYEGTVNVVQDSPISIQLANGTYTYNNGDKFTGDLTGDKVCMDGTPSFYIAGTTFFKNGESYNGNWLSAYKLTEEQWNSVFNAGTPSDALALAKQYKMTNELEKKKRELEEKFKSFTSDYLVFQSPEGVFGNVSYIEFLNPLEETMESAVCEFLTKEKETGWYQSRIDRYDGPINLQFAVDDNGRRLAEVAYEKNESKYQLESAPKYYPKYITYYEWYSNGIIKSIKSYSYDDELLILSCNFYSDGKLRSAYRYEINTGKSIIRKSKESHPNIGGYTSKLYDLDGNYERVINWDIGDDSIYWNDWIDDFSVKKHRLFPKDIQLDKYKEYKPEEFVIPKG